MDNVLIGCLGRMPRWRGSLGLFNCEEKQRAMAALDRVGLADLAAQRASTLSGGQQQRVAIARALTQRAEVILADEPIASLDPESAAGSWKFLPTSTARMARQSSSRCIRSITPCAIARVPWP